MSDLTETAKYVFLGTLQAIEPGSVISRALRLDGDTLSLGENGIDLAAYTEVVIIGMGKASVKMGAAVESLLGDRVTRGVLVTDRRPNISVKTEVIVAGHPLPDSNSLIAGERIVDLVESCSDGSLIFFLISGGGSALAESPITRDISLEDLRVTNQILTGCGASIHEINAVRKQLSRIKGGRLGYIARNSQCAALFLSDVNPGDIRSIASNPLLPEGPGAPEVIDIIDRFRLMEKLPASVVRAIARGQEFSTPVWNWGEREPVIMLLVENSDAVRAAAALAQGYGFRVEVDDESIEGDYKRVAHHSVERLLRLKRSFPGEGVCLISGGEVLCPVSGEGVGGRNQEFVLYCATLLAGGGSAEVAVLSCGTDGIDGNSMAAGAGADAESIINAARNGIDATSVLSANDSHSLFKHTGGLVVTGPTGNNVRDLRILMTQ